MPSQLFSVIPNERYIVLQLQVPNLDADACDELQATLSAELESRNCPVVIDLARAKFLPSLALGLLVNLKRKLDERNSHMVITGLAPNIRRALSLSSLDRVFHLADSMDQLTPEQMAAR